MAKSAMRTIDLDKVTLESGSHSPDGKFCVMELSSFIAGEPWSDNPECVSPVLGAFLRAWNDGLDARTRQKLKPYATKVIGTAGDHKADERRAWMATDWFVRTCAPAFLRLAQLDAEADTLASLPELKNAKTAVKVQPAIQDLIVEAGRQLAQKTVYERAPEVREQAAKLIEDMLRERLAPQIEQVLTVGIRKSAYGDPVPLPEYIAETVTRQLTIQNRDASYRSDRTLLENLLSDEVKRVVGKELREVMNAAKERVREAVETQGAQVIRETIERLAKAAT